MFRDERIVSKSPEDIHLRTSNSFIFYARFEPFVLPLIRNNVIIVREDIAIAICLHPSH